MYLKQVHLILFLKQNCLLYSKLTAPRLSLISPLPYIVILLSYLDAFVPSPWHSILLRWQHRLLLAAWFPLSMIPVQFVHRTNISICDVMFFLSRASWYQKLRHSCESIPSAFVSVPWPLFLCQLEMFGFPKLQTAWLSDNVTWNPLIPLG